MRRFLRGATSQSIKILILDTTSGTGSGLTGLTFGSSGLNWYYCKDTDSSATQVTLATMTLGTWATGGFIQVDATNMPGWYEIGIPNACLTTGKHVIMTLKGATNMAPVFIDIELQSVDMQDSVRQGLTSLPNAAAGANGGLPTGDASGRVTVITNSDKSNYTLAAPDSQTQQSGTAQAGAGTTITLAAGASSTNNLYNGQIIKIYGGTGAGQTRVITGYIGSTKVATIAPSWIINPDNTSMYAVIGDLAPLLNSSGEVEASSVQGNITGSVASVTSGVTVTTNNDKTSYSLAALDSLSQQSGTAQAGGSTTITLAAGASATDSLYVGEVIKIYSGTGAGQTRVITAYVGSTKVATVGRAWITTPDNTSIYSIQAVQSPILDTNLAVTTGTNSDKTGYGLTTSERDSIANDILDLANGVESGLTVRQAMRLFRAILAGISTETSGTVIFKRADGTTTALTVVHDNTGSRSTSTIGTL